MARIRKKTHHGLFGIPVDVDDGLPVDIDVSLNVGHCLQPLT